MTHAASDGTAHHIASRLEDLLHHSRARRARARGLNPLIMPYLGYGYSSPDGGWVRVFARAVLAKPDTFENGRHKAQMIEDGIRGFKNFTSPVLPFGKVNVQVAGQNFEVVADRGGVVDAKLAVNLAPGWQEVELRPEGGDSVSTEVLVIGHEQRTGVICDVDDTVVVTALPRPLLAAWNSFVLSEHARVPTPGMAVMMERLVNANAQTPTVYLSTGAWNVAQTLTRFLTRNLYPRGPLLLTDWGPTTSSWFRSGVKHKVDQLRRLAEEFPHIQWVLIGDDGQHDPSIYAEFARRYPQHVRAIVIRQLTPSEAVLAGGRSDELQMSTPDTVWVYEADGSRIAAKLEEMGILGSQDSEGK
ncbi:App1 family protein [Glutamicibacter uratoxydans]|uniref:App1 family protein n=1 Tax=Glutamicibacter uratoxydans TaxID=43667 RepID=UPI003D6E30F5